MNDTRNGSAPDNPMGTDGFEFVEYTAPDPELLGELFEQLGFSGPSAEASFLTSPPSRGTARRT